MSDGGGFGSFDTELSSSGNKNKSSQEFSVYEKEFAEELNEVRRSLAKNDSSSWREALSEATGTALAMDYIAEANPNNRVFSSKVSRCRAELKTLTNECNRTDLLSTSNSSTLEDPFGLKLVDQMSFLNSQTEMIANSQRLCAETEDIGANVLTDMGGQREQLLNANEQVHDMRSIIQKAKSVLRSISRQALYQRLFLYFVVLFLFVSIVLDVWYRFIKRN
jgi:vesicle transport through interaction with t-SNAREs protein 1